MTPQPAKASKGFKIDLNATLVDLSQFKRTKKPAWPIGKELDHRTRVALFVANKTNKPNPPPPPPQKNSLTSFFVWFCFFLFFLFFFVFVFFLFFVFFFFFLCREMLDTEQSYVLGLCVLLENYMKPLQKYCKVEPKIAESDVNKIFADGSLEAVYVLNSQLIGQLEERLAQWETKPELGDIFDKFAPLLKPYSRYGSKYEECLSHVTELQQKNPKFKKVFEFYDDHAFRFSGLRLKDYMITPVQRVPRFGKKNPSEKKPCVFLKSHVDLFFFFP